MWTRALLKYNAKNALQGRYGRCILVSLVAGLLCGMGSAASRGSSTYETVTGQSSTDLFYHLSGRAWGLLLIAGLIGAVLAILYSVFVAGPLQVGLARYYMENRSGLTPWSTLWSVFRPPYLNVVKVRFLVTLKIALGFLLIIPGIYWTFCYYPVSYLLAENPYLSASRAMELSREMMDGEKWNTFVLLLSFLGWAVLCIFTLGIGYLFLTPYVQATMAELYAALRAKALARGMSDTSELGGFVRHG